MFKKPLVLFLSAILIWSGLIPSLSASVISTQQAVTIDARQQQIADIQAKMAREGVSETMIKLGVDPLEAQLRVASLSDQELAQLDQQIDKLPVGGGVVGIVGVVFVVLIILEIVGVVDIFKK